MVNRPASNRNGVSGTGRRNPTQLQPLGTFVHQAGVDIRLAGRPYCLSSTPLRTGHVLGIFCRTFASSAPENAEKPCPLRPAEVDYQDKGLIAPARILWRAYWNTDS